MLALMTVAGAGESRTLVFDEVDAGVGGQTARAVGERLRALGQLHQVLCITHLPQVAAQAESPLPHREDRRTPSPRSTTVEWLEGDDVVEELCRMLGAGAERRRRPPARPRSSRGGRVTPRRPGARLRGSAGRGR